MNIKQLIVFFSFSAAFFLFILIYNVYAQSTDMSPAPKMQSGDIYANTSLSPAKNYQIHKSESDLKSTPKFTARPKPAGAPAVITNEAEAELLFAKK